MPTSRESRRFTDEQMRNARVIISVGRSVGASDRDILIALMTGFQESGLRNINYGDRDSIGIFQQRNAWGSTRDRLDPVMSARMFFTGGRGGQRGLLDFKQRNQWSLTQAAQKVQVSAFPDAYAKHEGAARALYGELSGSFANLGAAAAVTPDQPIVAGLPALADQGDQLVQEQATEPAGVAAATAPGIESADQAVAGGGSAAPGIESADREPEFSFAMPAGMPGSAPGQSFEDFFPKRGGVVGGGRSLVIQYAKGLLGTPYVFGGNDPSTGLDCSSFTQLALRQAGIELPRISYQQANGGSWGQRTSINKLKAGDLVAWDNSSRNNGADHVAIYLGNGMVIEEPRPGLGVRIRQLRGNEGAWGVALNY